MTESNANAHLGQVCGSYQGVPACFFFSEHNHKKVMYTSKFDGSQATSQETAHAGGAMPVLLSPVSPVMHGCMGSLSAKSPRGDTNNTPHARNPGAVATRM